jgi:6,7-dimethyl-8-ribityllumazine synthase
MNQMMTNSLSTAATAAAATSAGARIAVICASWHTDIVDRAKQSLLAEFDRSPTPPGQVDQFEVPGAFEIPLLAQTLARSGRYDAVVACALVVNGGIYRHEFVGAAVIDGLMRVQLDTGVPVMSAVLTPRDFHEHEEHRRFFAEHFIKKGVEVAQACLMTIAGLRRANLALATAA